VILETKHALSVMQGKSSKKLEKNAKNTPVFDGKNAAFSDFTEKYVVSTIDVFNDARQNFTCRMSQGN
jgi:hypothetical protein